MNLIKETANLILCILFCMKNKDLYQIKKKYQIILNKQYIIKFTTLISDLLKR